MPQKQRFRKCDFFRLEKGLPATFAAGGDYLEERIPEMVFGNATPAASARVSRPPLRPGATSFKRYIQGSVFENATFFAQKESPGHSFRRKPLVSGGTSKTVSSKMRRFSPSQEFPGYFCRRRHFWKVTPRTASPKMRRFSPRKEFPDNFQRRARNSVVLNATFFAQAGSLRLLLPPGRTNLEGRIQNNAFGNATFFA